MWNEPQRFCQTLTLAQEIEKRVNSEKINNLLMTYPMNASPLQDCGLSLLHCSNNPAASKEREHNFMNTHKAGKQKKCCMNKGSWIMPMQTK